jgi:hypothetical protein
MLRGARTSAARRRLGPAARGALIALAGAACGAEDGAAPPAPRTDAPSSAEGPAWFVEEARERGLDFVHDSGHRERFWFPESVCGGAALFDADGDGDLDAYLVQAGSVVAPRAERPPNRLYRNLGAGTFADATEASGAGDRGYGMGAAVGDADGDGDPDLYVTNVDRNTLLLNEGGLRFRDDTERAGVASELWGASAAFFDADADGDLDLFVADYLFWTPADELECRSAHGATYCNPKNYMAPAPDLLYRNAGDGTFADVSAAVGLRTAFGNGLGVLCADFDGDGWTDVFVANDAMPDQLWRNLGGERFEDVAAMVGVAVDQNGVAKAGMGVDATDLDFDGDPDLLVVNIGGESDSYYRNERSHFGDRTPVVGLGSASRPFTRFGVGFADFDQDGFPDLYQANGRVTHPSALPPGDPFAEPNLLMRWSGARFEEVRPRGGTRELLVACSRAAAFGDVDGDGAVDVLVANRDGPAHLLLNRVPGRGGWIRLRVVDAGGADALGAEVSAAIGARRVTRAVRSAYSYCAASDARVHLGLASETAAREVEVRWPDGARERFGDLPAGREHLLRRGAGAPLDPGR